MGEGVERGRVKIGELHVRMSECVLFLASTQIKLIAHINGD